MKQGSSFIILWWPFCSIPPLRCNVAYTSLTPTLTEDYDERTNLNSYRFSFSILGSVTAATLHLVIVNAYPDDPAFGNMVAAGIWTIFIIVPNFITFAFTEESHFKEVKDDDSFVELLNYNQTDFQ